MIEPEDYELEDETTIEEPPDISSYFNTPFNEERLQNVHRLRSTPYKEEAKYELLRTTLYPRAKKGLTALIDQFLSERTILANFPSTEMALLDYDIAEIGMIHTLYPSDLKNPGLFHMRTLIRTHYKTILTNAHGLDRERIINGRESMEQRHVTNQDPIMVKKPPKRKNILGF